MTDKRSLKGQAFLIGAILVCVMFFLGLPKSMPIMESSSNDLHYFSLGIRRELPMALNFGLNESAPIPYLKNFTLYSENTINGYYANFSSIWVVSRNLTGTGINITVGNFLGSDTSVNLTISGTEKQLSVKNNATNSTTFSSISQEFNLTIEYGSESKTLTWQRNKVNLYASFGITRENNKVSEEIVA